MYFHCWGALDNFSAAMASEAIYIRIACFILGFTRCMVWMKPHREINQGLEADVLFHRSRELAIWSLVTSRQKWCSLCQEFQERFSLSRSCISKAIMGRPLPYAHASVTALHHGNGNIQSWRFEATRGQEQALQVRVHRCTDAVSSSAEPSSTTHPFEIKQAAAQCVEASAR